MTSPHVHRRAPPVPTERDLRLWRDLIAKAVRCADRPERDGQALYRAAMRAHKAVMPVGHQHGQSAFIDLIKASEYWRSLPATDRAEVAANLALKADACRAVLDGDEAGPERPLRKDIFG